MPSSRREFQTQNRSCQQRALNERPNGAFGSLCVLSEAYPNPSAFLFFRHGFAVPPSSSEEGFRACTVSKSSLWEGAGARNARLRERTPPRRIFQLCRRHTTLLTSSLLPLTSTACQQRADVGIRPYAAYGVRSSLHQYKSAHDGRSLRKKLRRTFWCAAVRMFFTSPGQFR